MYQVETQVRQSGFLSGQPSRKWRQYRAVGRYETPGVALLFGGHNLPPLVEIGLTDLPKSGGARHPQGRQACISARTSEANGRNSSKWTGPLLV